MNTPQTKPEKQQRLYSLDVLRGFDMFWIIGGAYLIRDIDKFFQTPFTKVLQSETHHVQWEGFVYYDQIGRAHV